MLPNQEDFESTMYRVQRYIVVRGHALEAGLAAEGTEAYEFNIKFDLSELETPSEEVTKEVLKEFFDKSATEAMDIWPWITGINQVGRSGGWVVVKCTPPGYKEWVAQYANKDKQESPDSLQLLWMVMQHRLDDLDAINAFILDQQATLKAEWSDLIKVKK